MRIGTLARSLVLALTVAAAMAAMVDAETSVQLAPAIDGASREIKTGFLIPSQCKPEEGLKPEPKGSTDAWPAPHTTACALRLACIESGFGLWVVDRFYHFDKAGHEKALRYFQTTKRTSYNKVRVTGDFRDPGAVRVEKILLTD